MPGQVLLLEQEQELAQVQVLGQVPVQPLVPERGQGRGPGLV